MRAGATKPAELAARIRRADESPMTGIICPDCGIRYLPRFGACCQKQRCAGADDRPQRCEQ